MEEEGVNLDDDSRSVPVLSAFINRFRNAAPAPSSERLQLSADRMWWLSSKEKTQSTDRATKLPNIGFLEKSVDFSNDNQSTISSIKVRQSGDQSLDLTSIRSSVDVPLNDDDDDDEDDSVLRQADALYKKLCNNLKELQSSNPARDSLQLPIISSVDSDLSELVKSVGVDHVPIDSLEFDHLRLKNALNSDAADVTEIGEQEECVEDCDSPIVRDSLDVKPEIKPSPPDIAECDRPVDNVDELQVPLSSVITASQSPLSLPRDFMDEPEVLQQESPIPYSAHPPLYPHPTQPFATASAPAAAPPPPPSCAALGVDVNSSVDSSLFMYMSSDDEEEPAPKKEMVSTATERQSTILDDKSEDWTLIESSDLPEASACVDVNGKNESVAVTETLVSPWLDTDEELRFLWERLCQVRAALRAKRQ